VLWVATYPPSDNVYFPGDNESVMPAAAPQYGIVAYLALFAAAGIVFILAHLLVGRFLRPRNPSRLKQQVYECGEQTIGSGFVQFDLRFYVVALVFIILDVEVAFFFPWATVFGKATHLASPSMAERVVVVQDGELELTGTATALYREMGIRNPKVPVRVPRSLESIVDSAAVPAETRVGEVIQKGSRQLALITLIDIGIFFAVLLVGFAYVWYRRDLDWVRSLSGERAAHAENGFVDSTTAGHDRASSAESILPAG
jgi:NADH-quinone oxidoreductase subunit A